MASQIEDIEQTDDVDTPYDQEWTEQMTMTMDRLVGELDSTGCFLSKVRNDYQPIIIFLLHDQAMMINQL